MDKKINNLSTCQLQTHQQNKTNNLSTRQLKICQLKKDTSGGYCGGVPPLPIPNREVKPTCADGTAMQCGRVGSRLLLQSSALKTEMFSGLFCLEKILIMFGGNGYFVFNTRLFCLGEIVISFLVNPHYVRRNSLFRLEEIDILIDIIKGCVFGKLLFLFE